MPLYLLLACAFGLLREHSKYIPLQRLLLLALLVTSKRFGTYILSPSWLIQAIFLPQPQQPGECSMRSEEQVDEQTMLLNL